MLKKEHIKKMHHFWPKIVVCFLLFTFGFSTLFSSLSVIISNDVYAAELIEDAFMPARTQETIINLWLTKDAVGNEILRESVWWQSAFGQWCFVDGQRVSDSELDAKKVALWYPWTIQDLCQNVLWWDWDVAALTKKPPLIVRITKFLLRLTIILSITMVIYSGIMYIIESSKWAEVKEATNSLMYIVGWVLLALMSLSLINLITSISVSTLGGTDGSIGDPQKWCTINGQTMSPDDPNESLQQYICLRADFGHIGNRETERDANWLIIGRKWVSDNTMQSLLWNKCYILDGWKKILDSELEPKCVELGWTWKE